MQHPGAAPARSLRRAAQDRYRQVGEVTAGERLSRVKAIGQLRILEAIARPMAAWFIPLVAVVPIIPLFSTAISLPGLDDPEHAGEFLGLLWQVEAAALALSIAIIALAFEVASTARGGLNISDFLDESWLLPSVYLILSGLITDGAVLLWGSEEQLAGWSASWAIILSLTGILAIGPVFVSALRSIDSRRAHERGLAKARWLAEERARHDAFIAVAAQLLDEVAAAEGFEVAPTLFSTPTADVVTADAPGAVHDIRLRELVSLVRSIPAGYVLHAQLGASVTAGGAIQTLPPGVTAEQREAARRVVVIR